MKMGRSLFLLMVLVVLGTLVWFFWPPSDEAIIRRRLAHIAQWSTYGPDEVPLRKIEALGQLKKAFHSDISLRLNLQGRGPVERSGRDSLMEAVQAVRFQIQSIQLEFLEPKIEFASDQKSAQVLTVMKARLGEDADQFLELKMDWIKLEGDWWLRRIETVKTWGR